MPAFRSQRLLPWDGRTLVETKGSPSVFIRVHLWLVLLPRPCPAFTDQDSRLKKPGPLALRTTRWLADLVARKCEIAFPAFGGNNFLLVIRVFQAFEQMLQVVLESLRCRLHTAPNVVQRHRIIEQHVNKVFSQDGFHKAGKVPPFQRLGKWKFALIGLTGIQPSVRRKNRRRKRQDEPSARPRSSTSPENCLSLPGPRPIYG